MDIITMHWLISHDCEGAEEKNLYNFIHFHYAVILAIPMGLKPKPTGNEFPNLDR